MHIQFIRHATLWLEYAGVTFLIDPMFSDESANPPITNSGNERRNPLVPLPGALDNWLSPDAVLVTHLHRDHWDEMEIRMLSKSLPIFCQRGDKDAILSSGFSNIKGVQTAVIFRDISIHRTNGQHGTGEIGQRMGEVSGFVFQAKGEPTLYIAGDTIWCNDVKTALDTFKPNMTIVNAGGARFVVGEAITMEVDDVIDLTRYAPYTRVVAVHMDTINHCHVTRNILRTELTANNILDKVLIPEDGDWI